MNGLPLPFLQGLAGIDPAGDPVAAARAFVNARDTIGADIDDVARATQGVAAAAPFIAKAREEWQWYRNRIQLAANEIAKFDSQVARFGIEVAAAIGGRRAGDGVRAINAAQKLVNEARGTQLRIADALNSARRYVKLPETKTVVDREPAKVAETAQAAIFAAAKANPEKYGTTAEKLPQLSNQQTTAATTTATTTAASSQPATVESVAARIAEYFEAARADPAQVANAMATTAAPAPADAPTTQAGGSSWLIPAAITLLALL